MTGPMQVFGRGDLTFDERLAVEREYIENVSLGRDLRILLLTLPPCCRAAAPSSAGRAASAAAPSGAPATRGTFRRSRSRWKTSASSRPSRSSQLAHGCVPPRKLGSRVPTP